MGKVKPMKRRIPDYAGCSPRLGATAVLLLSALAIRASAEAAAAAVIAFDQYAAKVEARLERQHRSVNSFIAAAGSGAPADARLRRGELIIERLTPAVNAEPYGSLLHHWRGTAFVPGATAADFEWLMKDFSAYPRVFSPQVRQAAILSPDSGAIRNAIPDRFTASMRVRQRHVITVVMDTTYDVNYGRLDTRHGYSVSRSTKISEIASPGTPSERALSAAEEHGFLWRLNTYWSYEERDGGLYMQVESISLTRAIPTGLAWAVRPFVESVPRESLEFTLRSTSNALKKQSSR
jgi:hypothetical protein